ncbi:hypothetical protein [Parasitella parasitica]|uniref:Zn(2)-C6 fungal-type domain-containing protein n=1 Tax=Parasitella parasitica TaxID=35722 RepID=A0A0B7N9U7_9FUNG|nr:hypothetical protein [Parasitella parasitica]
MSPPSPTTNHKLSNPSPTRNQLVERCSSLRGCEPYEHNCVYSVVLDHSRSVFSTNTARRLSSGSACETCRRRKTKCDGNNPCNFCANNGIECINNSERRKRSVVAAAAATASSSSSSLSSPSTLPATSSSLATSSDNSVDSNTMDDLSLGDNGAIDRIEDRLRRIEKLMTAFTPSPLAKEIKELKHAASGLRKMSSPHSQPSRPATPVRQQRNSIHNAPPSNALKKQHGEFDRSFNDNMPYASPPNSNGSEKSTSTCISSPSSPPLSPRILKPSTSLHSTNVAGASMLNLSLSPSSSSTSSTSCNMQPSNSTPTSSFAKHPHQWKKSSPIPSLMDQLSKCTFQTTAMDYTAVHYPIYPITLPSTSNPKNMEEP